MNKSFYSENRRKIAAQMTANDVMLFFSGEPVRKSADENFPFFTNRNFLYLTGIKQEQSALLVTTDGCENLSAAIPATIEEIESLMALAGKPAKLE